MKTKSCSTNPTAFCTEMTSSVDMWRAVDTVYVRFSAGFDTVTPSKLTDKLMECRLAVQVPH